MLASFEDLRDNMLDYFSHVKDLEEITEDNFFDAVVEVSDSAIDIYTYDLLDSVKELHNVGAFDEVDFGESEDITGLIMSAQYNYYFEILMENYSLELMIKDLEEEE